MNLDILGYGDTFFVHPSLEGGALATALQQAASEFAMPVRSIAARNQYPASDHRIMMAAGIETLAIALIDGSEIDSIVQKTESRPRILTIIHTREDTIDKIRPEDIEKAFSVLHRMIRLIDT
jgi:hypothetical protein